MNLQLVKMEPQYRSLAEDMIREWKTSGEAIVPWAIDRADIRDFSAYMDSLEQTGTADGLVPESTFFLPGYRQKSYGGSHQYTPLSQ